jgi:hypothetical protein
MIYVVFWTKWTELFLKVFLSPVNLFDIFIYWWPPKILKYKKPSTWLQPAPLQIGSVCARPRGSGLNLHAAREPSHGTLDRASGLPQRFFRTSALKATVVATLGCVTKIYNVRLFVKTYNIWVYLLKSPKLPATCRRLGRWRPMCRPRWVQHRSASHPHTSKVALRLRDLMRPIWLKILVFLTC